MNPSTNVVRLFLLTLAVFLVGTGFASAVTDVPPGTQQYTFYGTAMGAGLGAAMDPANIGAFAGLNGEITRQASMIGYVDVFRLGLIASLAMIPLVLLLRPPRAPTKITEVAID